MKQIDVTILGQSYLLGCPDGGEAALQEAVATVDREMLAIRNGGKVRARERIAVLAALNLAYALVGRPAARPAGIDASPGVAARSDAADVEALIRRLDLALGADGQLI